MKVVEFESFEKFEESKVAGQSEVVAIVHRTCYGRKQVCADLMTDCKHWRTAVNRFFKAIGNDERFDGWKEGIIESCEYGYFSDKETYWVDGKGSDYEGGYHWEVEDNDGSFYVELTVVVD
ncbi:MAG: hypothetical protein K1W18_07245 [Oscillospiraceae bacterium]